mmetsp:Transcript_19080/g.34554  ORF Transcript_19080/g.34554 Transcript_19080/m.34554 type:complete len:812 (-) Transcript_19080:151-2586(-)
MKPKAAHTAVLPWRYLLQLLGITIFVVVMTVCSVSILHSTLDDDAGQMVDPVHVAHPEAAKRGLMPRPAAKLESMAVVLPCAQEGQLAVKTIESIWNASNQNLLKEILVVDDGSQPPLVHTLRAAGLVDAPDAPPVKVLRHEKTIGLIGAKNTGGYAAVSDVIVFLDCHVKPRVNWDEAIVQQMARHGDHRTVVVPQIGMLDADTWEEIPSGDFHKACFVSWDIGFPWLPAAYVRNDEVPVMSGGLLAITRQWWHETEGYDSEMLGWGGENIDQSLRTWLCGGRIELALGSIIAHMFRVTDKPQTHAKYHAEGADASKNRLRAAKAWMGDFVDKVLDDPEFEDFKSGKKSLGNMSVFEGIKKKLSCSDFTHFLDKFHYIYFDSGYIPSEVFQLQEESTGLCLERQASKASTNPVFLVPCLPSTEEAVVKQQWQPSNAKFGKDCCSGLMHWNTLKCLDSQGRGTPVGTWECVIDGMNENQRFQIDEEGQLVRNAKDCLAPIAKVVGEATHASKASSNVVVEKIDDSTIRLVVDTPDEGRVCASPGPSGLTFSRCWAGDVDQTFKLKRAHGGLEVRDATSRHCFDAAGEQDPIVYSCYEQANANQVWQIDEDRLCLQMDSSGYCLSMRPIETMKATEAELRNCDAGPGQTFIREELTTHTFHLRNPATDLCLTSGHTLADAAGPSIVVGPCEPNAFWKQTDMTGGMVFGTTEKCLDTAGTSKPVLYFCYTPVALTQRFVYDSQAQIIRVKGSNEEGRTIEQCLDVDPKPPRGVEIKGCALSKQHGVRWRKHNTFVPHEWKIWEKMQHRHPMVA